MLASLYYENGRKMSLNECKIRRTRTVAYLFVLILFISLPTFASAKPNTRGYYEYYPHTEQIPPETELYHRHKHEGAIHGYAYLVSSTGDVHFSYYWDAPYLRVFIENLEDYTVTVTWKCCFYVN